MALFHLLTHILIQQCGGDVCIFTQQTSVMGGCSPVHMLDVPGEEAGWACSHSEALKWKEAGMDGKDGDAEL